MTPVGVEGTLSLLEIDVFFFFFQGTEATGGSDPFLSGLAGEGCRGLNSQSLWFAEGASPG